MIEDFGPVMINSVLSTRFSGDAHWVWYFLTDPKYEWGQEFLHRVVLDHPSVRPTIRNKLKSYVRSPGDNQWSRGHTALSKTLYPKFTEKLLSWVE